jgi:hypothetical protein
MRALLRPPAPAAAAAAAQPSSAARRARSSRAPPPRAAADERASVSEPARARVQALMLELGALAADLWSGSGQRRPARAPDASVVTPLQAARRSRQTARRPCGCCRRACVVHTFGVWRWRRVCSLVRPQTQLKTTQDALAQLQEASSCEIQARAPQLRARARALLPVPSAMVLTSGARHATCQALRLVAERLSEERLTAEAALAAKERCAPPTRRGLLAHSQAAAE